MGDLKKGFKKLHKFARNHSIGQKFKRKLIGDEAYDQLHPIGTSAIAEPAPLPPVIPMPDLEELKRAKRRPRQTTGRASTILSDEESGMGL